MRLVAGNESKGHFLLLKGLKWTRPSILLLAMDGLLRPLWSSTTILSPKPTNNSLLLPIQLLPLKPISSLCPYSSTFSLSTKLLLPSRSPPYGAWTQFFFFFGIYIYATGFELFLGLFQLFPSLFLNHVWNSFMGFMKISSIWKEKGLFGFMMFHICCCLWFILIKNVFVWLLEVVLLNLSVLWVVNFSFSCFELTQFCMQHKKAK